VTERANDPAANSGSAEALERRGENELATKEDLGHEAEEAHEIALSKELKNAPPRVRKIFEAMMVSGSMGPSNHPIFEKIEPSHIDKFLDYSHQSDEREHEYRRSSRWFQMFGFVFAVLALFAATWLLLPDKDLLTELFKILVVFGGGVGAGYGFRARQDRQ